MPDFQTGNDGVMLSIRGGDRFAGLNLNGAISKGKGTFKKNEKDRRIRGQAPDWVSGQPGD